MFNTNLKPRRKVVDSKRAMRFTALAFFSLLSISRLKAKPTR